MAPKLKRRPPPPRWLPLQWTVVCACGNKTTISDGEFEANCVGCGTVFTLICHEKDQTIM